MVENTCQKINKEGFELIKRFESFQSKAYPDPVSKNGLPITIGYGTTRINGSPIGRNMTCTKEEAEFWLVQDVQESERFARLYFRNLLNDNQFSAIVSMMYNIGPGGVTIKDGIITLKSGASSTLYKRIHAKDYEGAANEILKWNRAGNKVVQGLVNRRKAEYDLFCKSVGS